MAFAINTNYTRSASVGAILTPVYSCFFVDAGTGDATMIDLSPYATDTPFVVPAAQEPRYTPLLVDFTNRPAIVPPPGTNVVFGPAGFAIAGGVFNPAYVPQNNLQYGRLVFGAHTASSPTPWSLAFINPYNGGMNSLVVLGTGLVPGTSPLAYARLF